MNKVLSAIKSLESASTLQQKESVNREVINSGSVENDASTVERKRKSSAASDGASITPNTKTRKKAKKDKNKSTKLNPGFDERCNQLFQFKEEFGHCNVPQKYPSNPPLGRWCTDMRVAYKKIQKGMKPTLNVSQDRIERLEEIGFQWQGVDFDEAFEKRCCELIAFKEEFGHCNVPQKYPSNPSLGNWCNNMRVAYKKIQKGVSQDRIGRLEEIGFQWQVVLDYDEAFEKHCRELIAFKEEFGHCLVPRKYPDNPSLGRWCGDMRIAYKKIQKGMKTNSNVSQDRIDRLEEIGFQWKS